MSVLATLGVKGSSGQGDVFAAWLGGGFMTLIGYSNAGEAHNVNKLLAPFGMSYTDRVNAWVIADMVGMALRAYHRRVQETMQSPCIAASASKVPLSESQG